MKWSINIIFQDERTRNDDIFEKLKEQKEEFVFLESYEKNW